MTKEAIDRLYLKAQNEATVFALRDLLRDRDAEVERLRRLLREAQGAIEGFGNHSMIARIDAALAGSAQPDALAERLAEAERLLDQARTPLRHGTPEQRVNMAHIITKHLDAARVSVSASSAQRSEPGGGGGE